MYNRLGILGAMDDEVDPLYALLSDKNKRRIGGVDFYEGNLSHRSVVLCCAGMGKANAAAATQLLITAFGCNAIVMCGIAGNMTNKIGVGDAVVSDTVVYHDAENRMIAEAYPNLQVYTADENLRKAAELACAEAGVKFVTGRIATGDLFIGERIVKERIAKAFAPDCVEMEGAAVAHISAKNNTPFVIVRIMSDDADEEGAEKLVGKLFDISEFIKNATAICQKICEKVCDYKSC